MKFATTVVIDQAKHEVRIDGVALPWYVRDVPAVTTGPEDFPINIVTLELLADNVAVINEDGRFGEFYDQHGEVGEFARRLVREGLLERLPWLRLDA